MPAKKIGEKIFDLTQLKKVFRFAAPYRKKIYASIFLSIVLAVISPLRPFLIQYTVNNFIKDRDTYWLILITVIQIGMLLFETALRFYFTYITAWLGQSRKERAAHSETHARPPQIFCPRSTLRAGSSRACS